MLSLIIMMAVSSIFGRAISEEVGSGRMGAAAGISLFTLLLMGLGLFYKMDEVLKEIRKK